MEIKKLLDSMESNFRALYGLLHPFVENNNQLSPKIEAGYLAQMLSLTTRIEDEVLDFRLKKIQNVEHPYLPVIKTSQFEGENSNPASSLPETINSYLNHKKNLIKYLYSVPTEDWERTGVHEMEGHIPFYELIRRMIDKDSWLQQELKSKLHQTSH